MDFNTSKSAPVPGFGYPNDSGPSANVAFLIARYFDVC
jgi:hypothetical protein